MDCVAAIDYELDCFVEIEHAFDCLIDIEHSFDGFVKIEHAFDVFVDIEHAFDCFCFFLRKKSLNLHCPNVTYCYYSVFTILMSLIATTLSSLSSCH